MNHKAIHDGIHQGMKQDSGRAAAARRGPNEARWILMDYLDVIVHVFTPDARDTTGSSSSGAKRRATRSALSDRDRPPGGPWQWS